MPLTNHPCLTCGACCACYSVDFSVYENQSHGGKVPEGLTVEVTPSTCRMRGTDHVPVRCSALTGTVGVKAACGIYEWRPSPCQELEMGSPACERARSRHGLPPVAPNSFLPGGPHCV
ncbi:MAG: YkgJ family cysteine cluster protein [Burkholderiaceae bacterium]|jgi:Fe-S-cluster containining protein|nr:YkgJ family cysteine cluster protein [Burkholderiaceae bacterium]